jgi:hypothetical protein
MQRQSHRKSIIDIAADIGVDDDFFGCRWPQRRRIRLSACRKTQ